MDRFEKIEREQAVQGLVDVLDSRLLTALAEPARIELLKVLVLHGRQDVAGVAAKLPQHRSVISRHLGILHEAGLLTRHKVERNVYYELDGGACVGKFRDMLEKVEAMVRVCCPPAEA